MDKGRYLVEAHVLEGRAVGELAAAHGVHRSWIYKLLARYRAGGYEALEPRSRRPRSCSHETPAALIKEIVGLRSELDAQGHDAGAQTIAYHLAQRHQQIPSLTTIWRILRREGLVVPQRQKRPKCSLLRFEADLPNECWQADVTHVGLPDGTVFEVLNVIDDHSRLCVASRAMVVVKATDVIRVLHKSAENWGYPASFLTDNGLIFTAQGRFGTAGAVEHELFALGIGSKHSRPYHPQTCGKVERFHQTLKKFLAAQEGVATKKQLQREIDRFVEYYNTVRPHRSLGRKPPLSVWSARERAMPRGAAVKVEGRRLRLDKVDKTGVVTLRYRGRLHHIGIGAAYKGWRVAMLVDGANVEIVALDGSPLRRLVLDPAKDYQPQA